MIKIQSFSYLYNQQDIADGYIIDVRLLPDPQGEPWCTDGRDPKVQTFVANSNLWVPILRFANDLALNGISVSFGCEGGKNRSVSCAEALSSNLHNMGIEHEIEHLSPLLKQA